MIIFTPKIKSLTTTASENVAISGAEIEFQDNFVFKKGNSRLSLQAQKQFYFEKNISIERFSTPHLYEVNQNSLKMERVNGQSWYNFFIYSDFSEVDSFFNNILRYLAHLKQSSDAPRNTHFQVALKLETLKKQSRYKSFINFLNKKEDINCPISFCHGDFTLSNMIFKDDIYLIDFLDSFVESYWVDIIKIRQDTLYKWCLIYNNINSVKCEIILNKLNEKINKLFKDDIENESFKILEAINILRIEPYIVPNKKHIINQMLKQNPIYEHFNNARLR